MIDMTREKCLELFHERVRRATNKEERAFFQDYADKLEVHSFSIEPKPDKILRAPNRERIAPNCGLLTRNGSENHCIGTTITSPV